MNGRSHTFSTFAFASQQPCPLLAWLSAAPSSYCGGITPCRYNEAFERPDFNLQQRVADCMLNLSVALLFGSGMPLT